jgi:hypothetical protein
MSKLKQLGGIDKILTKDAILKMAQEDITFLPQIQIKKSRYLLF